jgi:hypothetical protein
MIFSWYIGSISRNPINCSLHFYDFSLNCYGISNSTAQITKGSLYGTIHLSHGFHRQPPGHLILPTRGPWPEEEGEQRLDGHVPAGRATGGEVRGEGKLQGLTTV